MIKSTLRFGGEVFEIIIRGNELLFYSSNTGMTTTIDGLRLSKAGVLKEHPDLKDDSDWRKKAIDRLKEHIKSLKSEKEKIKYATEELKKFGYEVVMYQKAGFRPVKKLD
ncbi:MAG: hypothetical protein ACOC56_00445 [Atribacterota bacterium]